MLATRVQVMPGERLTVHLSDSIAIDLSRHGAAFRHDGCFRAGMAARLHFESGEDYRGVVRWSQDGRAGLFLTEPIPGARLESASRI